MTTLTIFFTVAVMGLACSFGCSTVTTPFILGSLLGEGKDMRAGRKAIAIFSLGKILSLAVMGLLASIFGSTVLAYIESIYPNSTIWIVKALTFAFGLWIIYTVFKKSPCSNCSSCSSSATQNSSLTPLTPSKFHTGFYFATGALYSTIPCAPLVTTLAYASTMSPPVAVLLLTAFGIVNSIVPVLGLASIVGLANTEFKRDAPNYLKYIKIAGGVILMLAAIYKV